MRLAVLLPLMLAACVDRGPGTFEIVGTVSGSPPATGKVVFVWDTLQQTYKWGDGTSTGTDWTVTLDPTPPDGALITSAGMAVGIPMLIDNSQTIADGVIVFDSTARLGIASDYGLIWKDGTAAGLGLGWDATFGASYSCAHCVRGGNGAHDSWELTPCANLTIVISAPTDSICNWN